MRNLLLSLKQRKFYIYRELERHEGSLISWAIYGVRQTVNLITLLLPFIVITLAWTSCPIWLLLLFLPNLFSNLIFFFFYQHEIDSYMLIIIFSNTFALIWGGFFFAYEGFGAAFSIIILIEVLLPFMGGFFYLGIARTLELNFNTKVIDKLSLKIKRVEGKKEKSIKKINKEIKIDKKYISEDGLSLQEELRELNASIQDKNIKIKRSDELYVMIPAIDELLEIVVNSKNLDSQKEAKKVLDEIILKLHNKNSRLSRTKEKQIIAINKELCDKI